MTDQIRENLEILAALQRADSEYDHLSRKLEGVDDAINALAEQLSVFQGQVDQGLLQLETLQKQYRADEGEVKRIESAIARSNEKLSSVKTNKEYQSMLKEIDELTLKKSDMEDRLLAMLDDIEAAERQGAILKADLADMSKEVQSRQDEIRQSAEVQRKSLAAIGEKRNDIWTRLDAKLQTLYSRAKQQGHGIAVAAVIDAVCQVCRVGIPPQSYIELMRLGSMNMCPNCQRIIYPAAVIDVD